MKIMYPLMLAFVMLTSCGSREDKSNNMSEGPADKTVAMDMSAPPSPPKETEAAGQVSSEDTKHEENEPITTGNYATPVVKIPEKIKKTAEINITVEDYKKARTEIEKIIKSGNGYIGSENEQNNTYNITNNMVIRVMNKDFDGMINKLMTVASNVNSKNITAEDVTAQFVDIQSRLKSKKEIEKRYLDILQKAVKVTDILEIEQKLGQIREEIEAKEGELKYLADQVDYSTINLNFHQEFEYTPTDKPGFFGRLGSAFGNGWSGFLTFLVGFVYAWPLWIILGLMAYFLFKFIKRQLKKK
jgi:hypothetical protein